MNNDSKKLSTYFKYISIFIYFIYTCIYVYIGLERYILTCHGGEDSDEFHFYF